YFRAKLENLSQQSQAMLPILPEKIRARTGGEIENRYRLSARPAVESTACTSAASFCPDSRRRFSPPSCQPRFCQKSSSALRLPRKILRSALRMLATLIG